MPPGAGSGRESGQNLASTGVRTRSRRWEWHSTQEGHGAVASSWEDRIRGQSCSSHFDQARGLLEGKVGKARRVPACAEEARWEA